MLSIIRPALLTLASALLVSACASTPQHNADVPSPESTAASAQQYRCESGATLTARYPSTDAASIEYKDKHYDMQIAVSGSGARYVDDEREWWTKGTGPGAEGSLFQHKADGTTGQRIDRCTSLQE